jgi:hypothetical protein
VLERAQAEHETDVLADAMNDRPEKLTLLLAVISWLENSMVIEWVISKDLQIIDPHESHI